MKVIDREIKDLIPAEYNPRHLTNEQATHLEASLKRFGAVDPAIINTHPDRKNIIIGGHQRLKTAQRLGWETFPCVELELDKEKERELNIRLNKNTGGWDYDALANYFEVEELTEWGFSDEELFGDIEAEEVEAKEDDYQEPDQIHTDIVLGDLIEIGEHRLLCGDSTDNDQVARLMDGDIADAVFTDPPYALFGNSTGVADVADDKMVRPFFRSMLKTYKTITKPYGHIYVCCDWHSAFVIEAMSREVELKAKNLCIWDKGDGGVGAMYQQCYEMIWFFDNSPKNKTTSRTIKAGVRTVNGKPNIWRHNRVLSDRVHNAQKPVEMVGNAIVNSTENKEVVVDLFGGSGTTMVACENTKRKCRMMEMEPKYCQVIINRMLQLDNSLEIKINGEPYGLQD